MFFLFCPQAPPVGGHSGRAFTFCLMKKQTTCLTTGGKNQGCQKISCKTTVHDLSPVTELSRKPMCAQYMGHAFVTRCTLSFNPTPQIMSIVLQRKFFGGHSQVHRTWINHLTWFAAFLHGLKRIFVQFKVDELWIGAVLRWQLITAIWLIIIGLAKFPWWFCQRGEFIHRKNWRKSFCSLDFTFVTFLCVKTKKSKNPKT